MKVREWLNIHHSACEGLFHASLRDGGLGLPRLSRVIPAMQAKRIWKLLQSKDTVTREMAWAYVGLEGLRKAWIKAGGRPEEAPVVPRSPLPDLSSGNGGATDRSAWMAPCDWKKEEFLKWAAKKVQGVGVKNFRGSRESNAWLHKMLDLPEKFYSQSLQLRANVFPTREFMARGQHKGYAFCRACRYKLESTSHILGHCRKVQGSRMLRHNTLCARLGSVAKRKGWEVLKEKSFIHQGRKLRPDLVLLKDGTALLVDATVRFEMDEDTLYKAVREKVGKYGVLPDAVKRDLNVSKVKVYGFPIGARGLWHPPNYAILKRLGLEMAAARRWAKISCERVLMGSLYILRDFYSQRGGSSEA